MRELKWRECCLRKELLCESSVELGQSVPVTPQEFVRLILKAAGNGGPELEAVRL